MSMVDLKQAGDVFILTMNAGENRFNQKFIEAMHQALDTVEYSSGPAALVTTGGEVKFYSNGLDLDWLRGEGKNEYPQFFNVVQNFFKRILSFPIPTVAAINGHAFAAGAMMTLAHDFRVMRADRGFFCFPEVDINVPLSPGMYALIKAQLTANAFRELLLTGLRIGGEKAKEWGVVDEAVPLDQVLPGPSPVRPPWQQKTGGSIRPSKKICTVMSLPPWLTGIRVRLDGDFNRDLNLTKTI